MTKTIYTAFCRDRINNGTTWIDTVEAPNLAVAMEYAVAKCSFDWNYDPINIQCVGVIRGDVDILFWEN